MSVDNKDTAAHNSSVNNHKQPEQAYDVFSRGSLQLTYSLLRKRKPQLAMIVRNITGQPPLPKEQSEQDSKNNDFFLVELEPLQVRAIVETLIAIQQDINQTDPNSAENAGKNVLSKSLLEDWIALANFMISRLQENSSENSDNVD